MDKVSCEELARLVKPADRVAVLMVLRDAPGKPNGEIQLVTYGRAAADKAEAHNLKEWIKDEVFDGEVPAATVHESFILDAARTKEQRDALLAVCKKLRDAIEGAGGALAMLYQAECAEATAAIASAEGGS